MNEKEIKKTTVDLKNKFVFNKKLIDTMNKNAIKHILKVFLNNIKGLLNL
tara:strand:- start:78 stop:227 length:150 start_codon:yes stop_codon:yes gene_type:complete